MPAVASTFSEECNREDGYVDVIMVSRQTGKKGNTKGVESLLGD